MFHSIISLKTLSEYRSDIKNRFSSINTQNLSWLTLVIAAYLSIWRIDLIVYLLLFIPGLPRIIISVLDFTTGIINFIFAIYLVYRGMKQSDIFTGIFEEKYKTARSSPWEIDEIKNRIEITMASLKPSLDPELNLENLAGMVSLPARHLSQVINGAFNQNFFDFISDRRIEEANRCSK